MQQACGMSPSSLSVSWPSGVLPTGSTPTPTPTPTPDLNPNPNAKPKSNTNLNTKPNPNPNSNSRPKRCHSQSQVILLHSGISVLWRHRSVFSFAKQEYLRLPWLSSRRHGPAPQPQHRGQAEGDAAGERPAGPAHEAHGARAGGLLRRGRRPCRRMSQQVHACISATAGPRT